MAVNRTRNLEAAIAATRFGLGSRPGEIETASVDPRGWLVSQIRPEGADQPQGPLPSAREAILDLNRYQQERQELRKEGIAPVRRKTPPAPGMGAMAEGGMASQATPATMAPEAQPQKPASEADKAQLDAIQQVQRDLRKTVGADFLARARLACDTPASFRERWALFWFNHFTVSAVKLASAVTAGPFEREAIRPRVFGRFEDLLLASTMHPGMLVYLDQAQSIGPDSVAGRRRKAGLNENLAREIMELHTLGADAGYTQADVTEFARALTGWSIGYDRGGLRFGGEPGEYFYRDITHEPGSRTILGRRYGENGEGQARAVLHDLAVDPRTSRHISRKIAIHFVSDDPPESLVNRLDAAWRGSNGRLDVVAKALIEAPEAWDPQPRKLKTPYEFIVSGYRACGLEPQQLEHLGILNSLGQKPFSAPSPKGWPEEAAAWAGPDAIIKRLEWAKAFSAKVAPYVDPTSISRSALGERLGEHTATTVARAESRPEALALFLMSPEFQRR